MICGRTITRSLGVISFLNAALVLAFSPLQHAQPRRTATTTTTVLPVAADASVATTKEYQDVCGVSFNEESLEQRLQRTKFLYPKHVEVIDDLAPIADAMVDDIVRT